MAYAQTLAPLAPDDIQREAARLEAVDRLNLLDTPPEPEFDRITRLIRNMLGVKIAIVSLFDAHRQWYKACDGLTNSEVGRNDTFCRHVIDDGQTMIVRDTRLDPRFADNPKVTGKPYVRFYAGVPLTTPEGHVVGTVCAIDFEPKSISDTELSILEDLAALAMDLMERRAPERAAVHVAAKPPVENAAAPATRRRVLKAGQIVFFNKASTIDCTVRSFGADGAGIDIPSLAGVPSEFTLAIRADHFERRCRIVSRTDSHIDVEFC